MMQLCATLVQTRLFKVFFLIPFSVDSIMLLENNFKVTSTDASDKMLKQAWKIRWQRRKEEAFDNWGK